MFEILGDSILWLRDTLKSLLFYIWSTISEKRTNAKNSIKYENQQLRKINLAQKATIEDLMKTLKDSNKTLQQAHDKLQARQSSSSRRNYTYTSNDLLDAYKHRGSTKLINTSKDEKMTIEDLIRELKKNIY